MSEAACGWCKLHVGPDDGLRLYEPESGSCAAFCRLEHVVPWLMRGADWDSDGELDEDDEGLGLGRCAQCGDGLDHERILLVRHRGPYRIGDAFCGPEHLRQWASAGGRWRVG